MLTYLSMLRFELRDDSKNLTHATHSSLSTGPLI